MLNYRCPNSGELSVNPKPERVTSPLLGDLLFQKKGGNMNLGTKVKNKKSGELGVVVTDPYGCCAPQEVPVQYEGTTAYLGTDVSILEDLGPENAKADLMKCGAGQEKECCIFLVVGSNGPECQRFGPLRNTLISRKDKMAAQREPTELFPACQLS